MSTARADVWMPLYVAEYLADTAHLDARESGGYLHLIFHYWRTGVPLPDDNRVLCRIAKMTPKEWLACRPIIVEFFEVANGVWSHGRVDKELDVAAKRYAKRVDAARSTNAKRTVSAPLTDPPTETVSDTETDTLTGTQSQSHSPTESKSTAPQGGADDDSTKGKSDGKRGTRLAPDWQPSAEDTEFAREHGLDPSGIERAVAEFRDYWTAIPGARGCKLDWSATWRNRIRDIAARPSGGRARREGPGVVEIYADVARSVSARVRN